MKRHPHKHELLAYAENLVDRRSPISAKVGGHVASCRECAAEVEAMRISLGVVRAVPTIEPTSEFNSQLLLAAQNERRALQQSRVRASVMDVIKAAGYAAGLFLIAAVCFSAALENGISAADPSLARPAAWNMASPAPAIDTTQKAASELQTLAAAVGFPSQQPRSLWEREHLRAASVFGADIEAAKLALERNPGCDRARRIIDTNIQRQVQVLKALYVERSL